MKKGITTIALLVMCLVQIKAQLTELVAKNEKSIFQIFVYDEFGTPSSSGTGFFISQNGVALTNFHVLKDAKFAFIRDYKGNIFQIENISRISEECDLAEFNVVSNGINFPTLTLTNEIPPKGSEIFVIGNPEGLESTVSTGIISSIRDQENNKVIQISAPISPGSSGSPIMDMKGNVIGVATYQYKKGQNLNFGYWIGCKQNLTSNDILKISNNGTGNLYVINKVCTGQNSLILNSIEINEKNTVVNLSFINLDLAAGDYAFIFAVIGDKKQSFYIEDLETGKKQYAYDATIGNSAATPTFLKLGETKKFKLFFPAIKDMKQISIKEGMQGSDWSFENINLAEYKTLKFEDNNFFNNFYLQTGLSLLSDKEFASAYVILKEYADQNTDNDFAQNLAGIISFILGNKLDAFLHIQAALEINPTDSDYYFNLYFLNNDAGNKSEALKNITSSIQLDPGQPERYIYRSYLYIDLEQWKKAIEDMNIFINSDRVIPGAVYFSRAVCKVYIKDRTACDDFEKAYNMSVDKEEQEEIKKWYDQTCK
jgi:serine protease Do